MIWVKTAPIPARLARDDRLMKDVISGDLFRLFWVPVLALWPQWSEWKSWRRGELSLGDEDRGTSREPSRQAGSSGARIWLAYREDPSFLRLVGRWGFTIRQPGAASSARPGRNPMSPLHKWRDYGPRFPRPRLFKGVKECVSRVAEFGAVAHCAEQNDNVSEPPSDAIGRLLIGAGPSEKSAATVVDRPLPLRRKPRQAREANERLDAHWLA